MSERDNGKSTPVTVVKAALPNSFAITGASTNAVEIVNAAPRTLAPS